MQQLQKEKHHTHTLTLICNVLTKCPVLLYFNLSKSSLAAWGFPFLSFSEWLLFLGKWAWEIKFQYNCVLFLSCHILYPSPPYFQTQNDKSWILWHHNSWLLYLQQWYPAREDYDFNKEWKGEGSFIWIKGHFYATLHPKSLDWPLNAWLPSLWFPLHPVSMDLWFGLWALQCPYLSVWESPAGWLASGLALGFIYETCADIET